MYAKYSVEVLIQMNWWMLLFWAFFPLQTTSRQAFGKPLAAQGTIQADVALSRMEIEQMRLLVLKAAHMMDLYGNKVKWGRVGWGVHQACLCGGFLLLSSLRLFLDSLIWGWGIFTTSLHFFGFSFRHSSCYISSSSSSSSSLYDGNPSWLGNIPQLVVRIERKENCVRWWWWLVGWFFLFNVLRCWKHIRDNL